jgi:hypothetical protein
MKDDAAKKAGLPHSLSRKEEKKNKRNTDKKRRQGGKKEIERALTEKAVSKAQQRYMAMVASGKIKGPKGLSREEARKFAKTKHDDLPERVSEALSSFKEFLKLTS